MIKTRLSLSMFNRFIFSLFILVFTSCTEPYFPFIQSVEEEDDYSPIIFILQDNLPIDANGYYHLTLNRNTWQTLHRLDGYLLRNGQGMNVTKMGWGGSHYWMYGDFSCYVKNIGNQMFTDCNEYDENMLVPICNGSSYSREDGSVSTMIAPVLIMLNDTITIETGWYDDWYGIEGRGEPIKIVLD